ncbi:MAG: NYN domain-containing protein [Pseudomonadota bacterium]
MFDQRERIALFIDGANLYAAARSLGFDIDYRKLLAHFQAQGYLLRAYYYTALIEDQEFSSIRPLIDWLDYNGYTVITKPAKEFTDPMGRRKIKGNMDIELAIDAMELIDTIDHAVIFSGDGDFRSLVEALQRKGRKVSVVSSMDTQPPMIADDLRRQADHFLELTKMKAEIGREASDRPAHRRAAPAHDDDDDADDHGDND